MAFRTRYDHFEYMVMPFELAKAPATFQAYINRALAGLVDVTCIVYIDDILIYSKDPKAHRRHVTEVLERLRKHGLYMKLSKCKFSTDTVEFLGFMIGSGDMVMESSHMETILKWPVPCTYGEIQVFLDFTNFYRRFIANYLKIATLLTALLKGSKNGKKTESYILMKEAKEAFRKLKATFATAPVLQHFDPEKPIRIETDASGFAVAAILRDRKSTRLNSSHVSISYA